MAPQRGIGRLTVAQDTIYGRARRRVARTVHDLDDTVTRATRLRRRILLEAASPMSFGLFRPIYQRLRDDPRLELWFTSPDRAWPLSSLFPPRAVADRVISSRRAAWMKWDICINTDFWEMTHLRRRTLRVHLFHGVAGKYGLDAPVDLAPEIATFACLMFANEDRRDRYVETGLVPADGGVAALVGYPKADALVNSTAAERDAVRARLGLDSRPVVMYAPTWSPDSSLNTMGEHVIDGLAAAGLQVIVKLHDRSYDLQVRASGGTDWAQRLARYEGHRDVHVVRTSDATPLLTISDVLVTDHSSIGFEFMLLDRPLIIIDCPRLLERAQVSVDKIGRLRAGAEVVSSSSDVPDAVAGSLARPQRHSAARRSTAAALFYRPGTATDRAVALIYGLLDLPAPLRMESPRRDPAVLPVA
jgi:hypothetical protein